MPRTRAPDRLHKILHAATAVFIAQGYRGARIDDIAARAGVASGTVHLYARTKEALFDLTVRHAMHDASVDGESLPYEIAGRADIIERVWQRLNAAADFPQLRAAPIDAPDATTMEFEAIVREIYRWIMYYRHAIKLIERCAREWPELAALYYKQFRRTGLDQLTAYLERRGEQRALRNTADSAVAARVVLETIAFFALHRHSAPDSDMHDATAEVVVVDMLSHAMRAR